MTDTATFALGTRDRKRLAALLGDADAGSPVLVRTAAGEIELPAAAQLAVAQLLTELAAGAAVHVFADERDLTTQQAAELLGLSRTFVVRLIDEGKLPAYRAGTHRRVRASDAVAYARRRTERLAAVDRIAEADVAVGVSYR